MDAVTAFLQLRTEIHGAASMLSRRKMEDDGMQAEQGVVWLEAVEPSLELQTRCDVLDRRQRRLHRLPRRQNSDRCHIRRRPDDIQ